MNLDGLSLKLSPEPRKKLVNACSRVLECANAGNVPLWTVYCLHDVTSCMMVSGCFVRVNGFVPLERFLRLVRGRVAHDEHPARHPMTAPCTPPLC